MPEQGIGAIDWVGLNEDLNQDLTNYVPIDSEDQIDLVGLNKDLGFGLVEQINYDPSDYQNVSVNPTSAETPWYETAFSDLPNWTANRLMDAWYLALAPLTFGMSLVPLGERMQLDKQADDPKLATRLAENKQEQFLKSDFAPEIEDFFSRELPKGVESGAVQFIELMMGGKAETVQDKIEKLEIAGLIHEYQSGNTTPEDLQKELQWYQDRAENIPLARDIVAGITNSLFIMGSLAATGGLARFSTTGLKIGTREWAKAWGKGMLAQGKNTWHMMKYGATIGALNEAVQEENEAQAKGEEFTFWDFMAEVGKNQATKHAQAFLEGMSEGVLLGMPMGGVNMTKWLGKPISRLVKVGGKQQEVIQHLGTRKIRKLMNAATKPEMKKYYASHLAETIADRKIIARNLSKNFGKKIVNGLFVETSTEQITDAANDIMEGTHSSFIWLALGDDKQKKEALHNLIVEASVGIFLGAGVGMSDAWSRNFLEEIERDHGIEVAQEVEKKIIGQTERELKEKLDKAKGDPNIEDPVAAEEAAKAITVQDQGSGNVIPLVQDNEDEEVMAEVKRDNTDIVERTIAKVDKLKTSNILDYTFQQGKEEINRYLFKLSERDSKNPLNLKKNKKGQWMHAKGSTKTGFASKEDEAKFLNWKPLRYRFSSYMTESTIEGNHEMNEKLYAGTVKEAIKRGVLDKTKMFTAEDNVALAKDLAVGIMLNFDTEGWNYVKHKWKDTKGIDFAIEQSNQLRLNRDEPLQPNKKQLKLKGPQSIRTAQWQARRTYKKIIGEHLALQDQVIAGPLSVDYLTDEESADIAADTELYGAIIDEDGGADEFDNDRTRYQSAPTGEDIVKKASTIGDLAGVEMQGFTVLGDQSFATFVEPITGIKFTVGERELNYATVHGKATQIKFAPKMTSVGFRGKSGKIYKGKPKQTHTMALNAMKGIKEEYEDGFIDEGGKFYTRAEAVDITGLPGESFGQGVISSTDVVFQDAPINMTNLGTYGKIVNDFTGNTVSDFLNHLINKKHLNPYSARVADALLHFTGDKQLVIDKTMAPGNPAMTVFPANRIHINPNATLWHHSSVFDSLTHEMTHSYLNSFMKSGTQEAKRFNGKIRGVRNLVKQVLKADENDPLFATRWTGTYAELQNWFDDPAHRAYIDKAVSTDEEFLASVFSNTQFIKWITDQISVGGPKQRLTGWRRIVNEVGGALKLIGITRTATEQLFDIMERSHTQIEKFHQNQNKAFSTRLAKEQRRLNKNVTSGYIADERNDDEDSDEMLDPMQEWDEFENEGENQVEKASIENFITSMAKVWDITEQEYREYLKDLDSYEEYRKDFDEMDKANSYVLSKKIEYLYQGYHKNFKTVDEFKDAFLKRKYLNVVKKSSKVGYVLQGIKNNKFDETSDDKFHYVMRKVKDVYRDGNGKQRNTYKREIVLEKFIPELEKKLGLPKGTLGLAFVEGFESHKNGKVTKRTNLARLDKYMLGKDDKNQLPITQNLANLIWDANHKGATTDGMMYIGNFGGKNTLPILTFKQTDRKLITDALDKVKQAYNQAAMEEFGTEYSADPSTYKAPQQYGGLTRAILEELWFKWEDTQGARADWNKVMKRGPKWISEDTGILINEAEFAKTFGNAPINGMQMDGNDILINAHVVSSKAPGTLTWRGYDKVDREFNIQQLMINELGTSTIDGASFFIIGHFDKAYSLAHGTLKSGTIKNVYSSRVGEDPLYLKHAMHGVSADSPLGRIMLDNSIAVLISDEAMKEGPQDSIQDLTQLTAGSSMKPMQLKMSQFSRHSESQYDNLMSGATKQLMNGSAFSDLYNQILADLVGDTGGLNDILKRLSDNIARQTEQWFKKHSTPEAMHSILRDIVYNPKSPQEEKVSQLWVDYIEPLEGQEDKHVRSKYFGAWQHAHTAEVIRSRMQFKLNEMLAGKIPGARAVLQNNGGWANDVNDIKPITTNYNLAHILASGESIKPDIQRAAFPESGLYPIVQHLRELEKQTQRASNLEDKDDRIHRLKELEGERAIAITKLKEIKSDRLTEIVTAKTSQISPHSLVNWQHPDVQKWKKAMVWGTEKIVDGEAVRSDNGILDEQTGRLHQGWTILTEDQADKLGVKPGDWVIGIITPADSPLGVIGARVASVVKSNSSKKEKGRKTSDNSKAIFNSEWVQSMAGKDFDIDTISILTFDERYWTKEDFEKLAKIAAQIPEAYSREVAKETNDLFIEKSFIPKDEKGKTITVTKDNVFSEDIIRESYSILMNGVPRDRKTSKFSMIGDSFMELDSAYLYDPAPIVNERLHHTAASAINMRSMGVVVPFINNKKQLVTKFIRKGKESPISVDFQVRNKDWLRLHINHLNMTNADMDFPNKTSRLKYLSDPKDPAYKRKMNMYFWGLGDVVDYKHVTKQTEGADAALKINNLEHIFDALKSFQKLLFDDAFQLARGRNSVTYEKLDYFDTAQQIKKAQNILKALASGKKEHLEFLVGMWVQKQERSRDRAFWPDTNKYTAQTLLIKQQRLFLESFVANLEIDNVYDYPLFNSIKNINLEEMIEMMPGNIYKDHLINQVLASLETINYYPDLELLYKDQTSHMDLISEKSPDQGNVYLVSERIARKPAQLILSLFGYNQGDPREAVKDVRHILADKKLWAQRIKRIGTPAEMEDLKDAIHDFRILEARIGKAFEPFERDGELINVDVEVITMSRMLQSLDALEGRMPRRSNEMPQAYWRRQIRGFRFEVNQLIHCFDERGKLQPGRTIPKKGVPRDSKKHVSQQLEMQRAAASATYPILFKTILNTQYLTFSDTQKEVRAQFSGENVYIGSNGAGEMTFRMDDHTYTHNEINAQKTDNTIKLYKMLTQRSVGDRAGFWEGVEDSRQGTHNRNKLSEIFALASNVTMQAREEILQEYIGRELYESNRKFTPTDQKAFWIGMLAQTSDQGIQDRKATGMIVNQTIYDKRHPFKFQSNHLALGLLGNFDPELQNVWMQLYSVADRNRSPLDRQNTIEALKDGRDATVEMLYQDAPVGTSEDNAYHFFSDYVKEHQEYTKDTTWISYLKYTQNHTWAESLDRLRDFSKGINMLKALSENGVYYEDIVRDLAKLTNKQFMDKHKGVDLTHIRLALERYTGRDVIGQFLKQRSGESDVAFRTRSNNLTTFYVLNSARKREGARNQKLTFIRKQLSNIIGYDMHALLREKKTHIFDHKDEPIGFKWDTDGTHNFTVGDAVLAVKTHATRTFQGIGESIKAITKGQHINRTLAAHQVTLNNQAKNYEDVVDLMTNQGYRDKYRVQFGHTTTDPRKKHDDRAKFVMILVDGIAKHQNKQKEIRRHEVFKLAEDLKENKHVGVRMGRSGFPEYTMELGGKTHVYDTVRELINAHFNNLSAIQKLSLVGALDIRLMYDIHVPEFLNQIITYLEFTREQLAEQAAIDSSLKIQAMIAKYQSMLDMIKNNNGNYMPHQFPVARYKQAWMSGYLDHAVKDLERQIKYHQKKKGNIKLAQLDLVKDHVKIREMALAHAEKIWDSISHDWGSGALIPNFIPRKMPDAKGYTHTDPTIHYNYITKLIKGLKNDALYADWLAYQANARQAGERHSTIEITRRWYGDQLGDHTLRSVNQKWSDIEQGTEIHFDRQNFIIKPGSSTGYFGNVTVSGVVRKITADEVWLVVDTDATSWHARMALKKWEDRLHGWEANNEGLKVANQKLVATLQNLIKKQVLTNLDFSNTDLTKMTSRTAAEFIILGHKRILKDPDMIGRYKRTEVWGEDIMGTAIDNTVNVYRGQGVIERLEAKKTALKNLQLLGDDYTGAIPKAKYYRLAAIAHGTAYHAFGTFKKLSGLFYMGLASAGPARFTNQFGAIVNNLIDSPIYNVARWKEGNELWNKIKHGRIEQMEPSERRIYSTVVGLGLTEDNNILAIALEAANISPEDMILQGSKKDTIKWLARLFKDATAYDSTHKRLEALTHEFNLNDDPIRRMEIQGEIFELKARWKAKMHGLLSDTRPVGPQLKTKQDKRGKPYLVNEDGTKADKATVQAYNKQLWTDKQMFAKANELAKQNATMNIAQEQGFNKAMVAQLFAKVAWKGFFTSSIGMGFQARAEKMRVPAFFIGYTTAIHMGFDEEEALQLAVNSVELRHAFYGAANKQFGANTKVGSVGFQYAQYQYNAISKAVRIMREAVPQMIGFAYNKAETDNNWQHAWKMLKLIQETTDSNGKALLQPGKKISLSEINLTHGILMKIAMTGIMMQVGTRVYYGLTNIQDPVGQMVYRQLDYLFDVLGAGIDFEDDDDWDAMSYALQDLALPLGLLYKLEIQALTSMPQKGFDRTFLTGRVDNTFDFSWRVANQLHMAAYQLGAIDTKPHKKDEMFFDLPWLTDDFATGVKLLGWTSGSNQGQSYQKRGLYYGITDGFPQPYMTVDTRTKRTFSGGRELYTKGKGVSGFGDRGSMVRPLYLLDPLTYIPFLDRLTDGKTIYHTLRGK